MDFACLYLPNFILQAILRNEPALREQAVAILDGKAPLWTVVAVDEKTRCLGIRPGMSQTDVQQFPVALRYRSPAQESAAHQALLDLGFSFSPRIEDTDVDTMVLDLSGLEPLLGPKKEIAGKILQRAAEFGFCAQCAIAGNPDAAMHAARGLAGITVILPGAEAEALGPLPLAILRPAAEIMETLDRWGLRSFRDLAALPEGALAERLGQEGVHLQQLARGNFCRDLICATSPAHFTETWELENSVGELDPLSFLLGRLLDQVCQRLQARALAASAIELKFWLEHNGEGEAQAVPARKRAALRDAPGVYEGTLRLPVPTCDSKMLLRLWRLHLEADPPGAAILKILLRAEPARTRAAQKGLFVPLAPDPEKLEVTLARLTAVVGSGNAGSPELLNTHRPDALRMNRFHVPEILAEKKVRGKLQAANSRQATAGPGVEAGNVPVSQRSSGESSWAAPLVALRLFRPPLPAEVKEARGVPSRVSFAGCRGDVVHASGPWHSSGEWWRDEVWQQQEWDVELRIIRGASLQNRNAFSGSEHVAAENAHLQYRIFFDTLGGRWFVRGVYD